MRILVLRVIPAVTGIRPKHISHLGFVGDPAGPHGVRRYRVLPEIRAPAVGAREPPALAGAICHCPSHSKGAILASKPPETWRMSAHTVRCSDRAWSGHRPAPVGSLTPDPDHSRRGA